MAIKDRSLEAGTRLVATYKKERHVCTVERDGEGNLLYLLEDGREFKSPSSAGSAVMGGTACNGWRFWSVEGEEPPLRERPAKSEAKRETKRKAKRMIRPLKNQEGVAEGETLWWCDACMDGFTAPPESGTPEVCPEGHRVDDPQFA